MRLDPAGVVPAVNVPAHDRGVDRARDEDDGQRDSKSDLAQQRARRQQCGALHLLADKNVDERARERVDDDLDDAERPDTLDKVLGRVHLVHEAELADGEGVGEDDVAERDHGLDKSQPFLGPRGPRLAGRDTAVAPLDARADHGDADSDDDGGEVDVAQDGNLGERGRHGEGEQHHGGANGKDDRTGPVVGDVAEGDSAGQRVRSHQKQQFNRKHGAHELVAKLAHEQAAGVGVVADVGELELDLADDVGRVDGDEAKPHTGDDAGDHAQGGESGGDGQRAEGDGLDDQHDGQALPAEAVKLLVALGGFALLQVGPFCDLAGLVVGAEDACGGGL